MYDILWNKHMQVFSDQNLNVCFTCMHAPGQAHTRSLINLSGTLDLQGRVHTSISLVSRQLHSTAPPPHSRF